MPKQSQEDSDDLRSSRTARGLRLKSIRQSLRLSRRAFSEKFGVSVYTLQNWEVNKNHGLTEVRARQLVHIFKEAGIHCNYEWLMYGTGDAPRIVDPIL